MNAQRSAIARVARIQAGRSAKRRGHLGARRAGGARRCRASRRPARSSVRLRAQAGERVEQRAVLGLRVAHVAASRRPARARDSARAAAQRALGLAAPLAVARDVDGEARAEDARCARSRSARVEPRRRRARARRARRVRLELVPAPRGLALRRRAPGRGEQPTEIPVARAASRPEQQAARGARVRAARRSRPDDRAATPGARRAAWWKRGMPVEAVAVGERERVVPELRRRASTRSSGFEAPARKEKALRQRSST